VNTWRPKPHTAYEKSNDCMDDFWP